VTWDWAFWDGGVSGEVEGDFLWLDSGFEESGFWVCASAFEEGGWFDLEAINFFDGI
jgi:hypothetical protein